MFGLYKNVQRFISSCPMTPNFMCMHKRYHYLHLDDKNFSMELNPNDSYFHAQATYQLKHLSIEKCTSKYYINTSKMKIVTVMLYNFKTIHLVCHTAVSEDLFKWVIVSLDSILIFESIFITLKSFMSIQLHCSLICSYLFSIYDFSNCLINKFINCPEPVL